MIPSAWIEKAIRINSVTNQSNEAMVRFLMPLLEDAGLKVECLKVEEGGVSFFNLVARSHSNDTRSVLALHTHLDTVAPGDKARWTRTKCDPFRATTTRERIYGLGSADVKLDFLCKIMAVMQTKPFRFPFDLVGTYGEERGLIGAWKLSETKRLNYKYAVIGEPSNLAIIYAHKGHLIADVAIDFSDTKPQGSSRQMTWKGESAHSSTPQLGDNALMKALHMISKRHWGVLSFTGGTGSNLIPDQCQAELSSDQAASTKILIRFYQWLTQTTSELSKQRDRRFKPSHPTLSLNQARMQKNELILTFDSRLLPDTDSDALVIRWQKQLKELGLKVKSMTVDPPLKGSRQGSLIRFAESSLRPLKVKPVLETKASSTEAAIYHKSGAEAIVFGPGISIGNVHRPNEYMVKQHLTIATHFYKNLLQQDIGAK